MPLRDLLAFCSHVSPVVWSLGLNEEEMGQGEGRGGGIENLHGLPPGREAGSVSYFSGSGDLILSKQAVMAGEENELLNISQILYFSACPFPNLEDFASIHHHMPHNLYQFLLDSRMEIWLSLGVFMSVSLGS